MRREEVYEPRKSKPRSFLEATKALSDAPLSFAPLPNESDDECDGNDWFGEDESDGASATMLGGQHD